MNSIQPGDRVQILGFGEDDAYSDVPALVGVVGTVGDFVTTWPDGTVHAQIHLDHAVEVDNLPPLHAPVFYRARLAHVETS